MTTQEVAKGLLEALTVKKQLKQVKKVIEGAIDPVLNFRFANGCTPLHLALYTGKPKIVRYLCEQGANAAVSQLRKDGFSTPTMILAVRSGDYEMCQAVLSYGAHINDRDSNGNTALHFAAALNYYWVTNTLIANHADTSLVNRSGARAHEFVQGIEVARLLGMTAVPTSPLGLAALTAAPRGSAGPATIAGPGGSTAPLAVNVRRGSVSSAQMQVPIKGPVVPLTTAQKVALVDKAVAMGISKQEIVVCVVGLERAGVLTDDINILLDVHAELVKRKEAILKEKREKKGEAVAAVAAVAAAPAVAPAPVEKPAAEKPPPAPIETVEIGGAELGGGAAAERAEKGGADQSDSSSDNPDLALARDQGQRSRASTVGAGAGPASPPPGPAAEPPRQEGRVEELESSAQGIATKVILAGLSLEAFSFTDMDDKAFKEQAAPLSGDILPTKAQGEWATF